MALSDVEIWAEINAGYLRIDPRPRVDRVVASSVDLTLYSALQLLPLEAKGVIVNPSEIEVSDFLNRYATPYDLSEKGPIEMQPKAFIIGKTAEVIGLPPHLAARVEGRSSLGRLGLAVHLTAPTVHAGWAGRLTLEMYNAGPFSLKLTEGMVICQIILERLMIPAKAVYHGRFQGQS